MNILIVEDEPDALEILQRFLELKGHHVIPAKDGLEALERLQNETIELVLLDIALPKLDGWGVLEAIRAHDDLPVIMVTASGSTENVVKGLKAGTDDYVTKPFKLNEVEARIEAVMRRAKPPIQMKIGALETDDQLKQVSLHGDPIHLSPKEYELLKLLASDLNKVFSDEDIIQTLWPGGIAVSNDVKRYIHLLRHKIEQDPKNPERVVTVRGFGYRLRAVD
jgi:DNA-binding response OmpR family regulator